MAININVCIYADDNCAIYTGVVIASILLNAGEDDEFSFYVLDGGISDNFKLRINRLKSIRNCDINFIKPSSEIINEFNNIFGGDNAFATYYKLKLPEILPRVERVICLDSDVIVKSSLAEFFDTKLENYYIAGVLDIKAKYNSELRENKYVDSGVLLFDLNSIRWDNLDRAYIEYAKNRAGKKMSVQDIINYAISKKTKLVDNKWNVQCANFFVRSSFTMKPYIIRYISKQKPWKFGSYNHFKNEYFNVLAKTPWAIPYKERHIWGIWNEICSLMHFIIDGIKAFIPIGKKD